MAGPVDSGLLTTLIGVGSTIVGVILGAFLNPMINGIGRVKSFISLYAFSYLKRDKNGKFIGGYKKEEAERGSMIFLLDVLNTKNKPVVLRNIGLLIETQDDSIWKKFCEPDMNNFTKENQIIENSLENLNLESKSCRRIKVNIDFQQHELKFLDSQNTLFFTFQKDNGRYAKMKLDRKDYSKRKLLKKRIQFRKQSIENQTSR